ncbi:MAG: hypothetical protein MK101_12730 [Phycisphaerales bacterium]|nr:hypothetical protein [Phycisphaerales bacterium]
MVKRYPQQVQRGGGARLGRRIAAVGFGTSGALAAGGGSQGSVGGALKGTSSRRDGKARSCLPFGGGASITFGGGDGTGGARAGIW